MPIQRRATNLTVDADLLADARALNINLSRAAELGIARAVEGETMARRFAAEFPDVVRTTNEYVAKHGLPLRKCRSF